MNIFTYLNTKKKNKIIDFLDDEIDNINGLFIENLHKKSNQDLINYSKSLFVSSDKDENGFIILN